MAFEDTVNKAAIRSLWDLPVLERWYIHLGKPLSYFGLPGPQIRDLLDWREVLGYRTAVEEFGHNALQRKVADEASGTLMTNIMMHGLSKDFQLLRADIEDIIIDAVDKHGTLPRFNDGRPAHLTRFSYDVVNLDFDGGLGYRNNRGAAKRVEALKKLFERQEGTDFVLFLTINVRDKLGDEFDNYLRALQQRDRGPGWSEMLGWYLARQEREREYKLKATVPSLIHILAETRMFKSICRPPIVYDGYHARMIHFVFELKSQPGNLRAFSAQDDKELISLPFFRCQEGHLIIVPVPGNSSDSENIQDCLSFLPEATRTSFLIDPSITHEV